MALLSDDSFEAYKRRFVPILYDWFMHYHLPYPTQTCRWGPLVEDLGYKSRYRAYLSEQVVDGERPNTLLLAHIDVMKPHVASCEAVSNWQDKSVSSHVTVIRTVYHPGEVNKVRELPSAPHVVVTHTDSKHLYVWNMERQPDRRPAASGVAAAASAGKGKRGGDKGGDKGDASPSVADLVLTGHEDEALFPLACSSAAPCVASGGNDQLVLLWDLADTMTSLAAVPSGSGKEAEGGAAAAEKGSGGKAPQLKARTRLQGHTATVGDVCFAPGSSQLLVSVADDGRLLLWDTRSGLAPVGCVEEAHGAGVNVMCVDWCPLDDNMLVSGAEQGSIKVWDRRRVGAGAAGALFSFDAHTNNAEERDIIHVEWHPRNKDVFASGSVDRTVAIWDLSRGRTTPTAGAAATEPETAAAGKDKGAGGEAGAPAEAGKEKGGDVEMADAGASAGGAAEAGAAQAGAAKEGDAAAGDAGAEAGKAEAAGEGSGAAVADATAAAAAAAGEAEPKPQAEGGEQPGQESKDAEGADKGAKKDEASGAAEAAEGAEPPKKKKKTATDKDGAGDKAEDDGLPAQLIFQHLGHRLGRVTDFQWHPDPNEPWTLISVSDNTGDEAADGTMQVWRISDLIYRPYEEAVQELEQHRQFILHGNTGPSGGTDTGKGASAAAGGGKSKEVKAEQA